MTARTKTTFAIATLPLVLGACASLIGLEDAEVDDGATSASSVGTAAGPGSSGTGSSGTTDTASSATSVDVSSGAGGDSAVSGTGGSGAEGGGGPGTGGTGPGAGGGGGEGPVDGLIRIDGMRGVRLAPRRNGGAYLLGMRDPEAMNFSDCLPDPPVDDEAEQGMVLGAEVDDGCDPLIELEGQGLDARALTSLPGEDAATSSVAIGGFYRGSVIVNRDDEIEVTSGTANGGTFAFRIDEDRGGFDKVAIPAALGVQPGTSWAIPIPGGAAPAVSFGGAFSNAEAASCSGTTAGDALDDIVGYVARTEGGACATGPFQEYVGLLVVDAVPSAAGPAALYFDLAEGKLVAEGLVPELALGSAPTVIANASPTPETLSAFTIRAIPGAGSDSYFLVSGLGSSGACLEAGAVGPFVALIEQVGNGVACQFAKRPGNGFTRVVIGLGVKDDFAYAARQTVGGDAAGTWKLFREPRNTLGGEVFPQKTLCTNCEIDDMTMSGGEGWILGRFFEGATLFAASVGPGPFLYHAPYGEIVED